MDEQTPKARAFTRRRRANATGGRLHFHKVGVTPEEGGELARMAAISNNVNQMAKATNATGELPAELPATLAAVRRVAERLDEAIDRLSAS